MQVASEQLLTLVDYQGMMTESCPKRETMAQFCLVQVRRLPEAGGFKAREG